MILLSLILLTNCSRVVEVPTKCPKLLQFEQCDNLKVKTNSKGGFDAKEAFKLIDCYSNMKYYYRTRDESYNALFGDEK